MANLDAKITYAQDNIDDAKAALTATRRLVMTGWAAFITSLVVESLAAYRGASVLWAVADGLVMLISLIMIASNLVDSAKNAQKLRKAERKLRDLTMGWGQ